MIFGTEHDGGEYVDLVGGHGHPRADVRGIVMKGRMEDYRADLARRGGPIEPGEADRVAAALTMMPEEVGCPPGPARRRRRIPLYRRGPGAYGGRGQAR